jgi:hypothetical protein
MSDWLRMFGAVLALLVAVPALGREPAAERWTPVVQETTPSQIVNYTAVSLEEAQQMLEASDATLLLDAAQGYDGLPPEGFRMRSRRRIIGDDGFAVRPAPEGGWSLWRSWSRRAKDQERLDGPDERPLRMLGIPSSMSRLAWGRLSPYDPLVVEYDTRIQVVLYVNARVNDPIDPTESVAWAQLVAGVSISKAALTTAESGAHRLVLTLGGRMRNEPRLTLLPVDDEGRLDPTRDGVMVRFTLVQSRVQTWSRSLDGAVVASALRLHFGDDESLKQRLESLPPPPRERYSEPGGPDDPLMIAPRTPRDPLGAGVEAVSFVIGDLTLVDLGGTARRAGDPWIVPRWDGVDVSGWVGRVGFGGVVRQDLVAARVLGRLGRMRDTQYTSLGVEIGRNPVGYVGNWPPPRVALNAIIQSARPTGRVLLGQQIEMSNRIRVGTTGLEYEAAGGLRTYLRSGWVVTPQGLIGFRYALRQQRAYAIFGLGVEGTWNRNVFRR